MVEIARQALPLLSKNSLLPTLINARSAKPLDSTMLSYLLENPRLTLVTLEEGALAGGFGSAVLEFAAQLRARKPAKQATVFNLGIPDQFVEHGARQILLELVGLTPGKIAEYILKLK
jgi:1-deoxy-D-xylulose-5-phosphate synthase